MYSTFKYVEYDIQFESIKVNDNVVIMWSNFKILLVWMTLSLNFGDSLGF